MLLFQVILAAALVVCVSARPGLEALSHASLLQGHASLIQAHVPVVHAASILKQVQVEQVVSILFFFSTISSKKLFFS